MLYLSYDQGRRNRPPNGPGGEGGRSGQGPRNERRGVFLLGKDFNTCYDAALICCVRVCTRGGGGGGG